jgi:hypothetical protein
VFVALSSTVPAITAAMISKTIRPIMRLTLLGLFLTANALERLPISQAPFIENGHDVQFFVLETSFPYNAPQNIQ